MERKIVDGLPDFARGTAAANHEHELGDDKWRDARTLARRLEPDATLARLAAELPRHRPQRALDLGCGGGRHAVLLARNGFETYASDFSPVAVDHCRRWLHDEG